MRPIVEVAECNDRRVLPPELSEGPSGCQKIPFCDDGDVTLRWDLPSSFPNQEPLSSGGTFCFRVDRWHLSWSERVPRHLWFA